MTREEVKEALDSKGTKHAWIARQLGITNAKFSLYINGKTRLTDLQEDLLFRLIGTKNT